MSLYRNITTHLLAESKLRRIVFLNPVTDVDVVAEGVEIDDHRGTHVEARVLVGQRRAVETVSLAQH